MPPHRHTGTAESSQHRHIIPTDSGGGGEGWGQERMIQANVYNNANNWAIANSYAYTYGDPVAQWTPNSAPTGVWVGLFHSPIRISKVKAITIR
jgi:hypothetical protein